MTPGRRDVRTVVASLQRLREVMLRSGPQSQRSLVDSRAFGMILANMRGDGFEGPGRLLVQEQAMRMLSCMYVP
jgi:hypothetical protein